MSASEEAFEAQHPEIDVQWIDMGGQDAYDRIRTEQQNPQASIWWGGASVTFDQAAAGTFGGAISGVRLAFDDHDASGVRKGQSDALIAAQDYFKAIS